MSSDDDSQLRDLVAQTLESKGVLSKLRAELRANVFLALEGNEKFKEQLRENKIISDLLKTEEGLLALHIVKEFLEFCDLKFTQTVLESEIGDQLNLKGQQDLIHDLKIKQPNQSVPVLCQLVKAHQNNSHLPNSSNVQSSIPNSNGPPDSENHRLEDKKLVNGENKSGLKQKSRTSDEQLILDLNLTNMNGSQEDDQSTNPPSPLLLDQLPPLVPSIIPNSNNLIKTINNLEPQTKSGHQTNLEIQTKSGHQTNRTANDLKDNLLLLGEEKVNSPSHKNKDGDTGSVSEIEEDLDSTDDLLNSSGSLRDDVTQDNSISTLSSGINCDYMEDVNKISR
uniref:FGFR1 oncogene partner n=2 Tax=Cacopsylla melanoneura TaxID=428564 RepID=A0A8D8RXF3_9HEMI